MITSYFVLLYTTSLFVESKEYNYFHQWPHNESHRSSLPLLQSIDIGLRHTYRTVDLLNLIKGRKILDVTTTSSTTYSTIENENENNNNDDNDDDDDDVQELYFTQRLDHYNHHQNRTFQQRYFRSNRFMRSHTMRTAAATTTTTTSKIMTSTTIVFICVGGEGPGFDKSVLYNSVHCTGDMIESAQQLYNTYNNLSIILIALEHRYYGKSYPIFYNNTNNNDNKEKISPVTNENLIYLSSRQATADLAHFIHVMFYHQSSKTTTTTTTTTVSSSKNHHYLIYLFGGSYPGMIAAYTRSKYPYLIHGTISNSAPVRAILNFDTYQSHVGYNIKHININCYNIVTIGHRAITNILHQNDTTMLQSLAKQFNLCNSDDVLFSKENQNLFVGDGVIYFGAQENDPHCSSNNNSDPLNLCNMELKCDALTTQYTKEMNNTNTSIEVAAINALAYLARIQQQQQSIGIHQSSSHDDSSKNDNCFVVDWEGTLKYIADPILGQMDGLRSWLYQTCTEFGFYQTCYDQKCPFGIGYHTVQQDLYICQFAFNIYNTLEAVQNTNEWTGGWDNIEQISRIFSVTGTVDPWSEMAIQHTSSSFNNDPNEYPSPHQVDGASHHFWTHPSKDTDDDAIKVTRQEIYQILHDWIISDIDKFEYMTTVTAAR